MKSFCEKYGLCYATMRNASAELIQLTKKQVKAMSLFEADQNSKQNQ